MTWKEAHHDVLSGCPAAGCAATRWSEQPPQLWPFIFGARPFGGLGRAADHV